MAAQAIGSWNWPPLVELSLPALSSDHAEQGSIVADIVDIRQDDRETIAGSGSAACNRSLCRIATTRGLSSRPPRIIAPHRSEVRMLGEESSALRECHWVTHHRADRAERGTGKRQKAISDWKEDVFYDNEIVRLRQRRFTLHDSSGNGVADWKVAELRCSKPDFSNNRPEIVLRTGFGRSVPDVRDDFIAVRSIIALERDACCSRSHAGTTSAHRFAPSTRSLAVRLTSNRSRSAAIA